jgi:hypothetical protein
MKSLVGIGVGFVVAIVIAACAAAPKKSTATAPQSAAGDPGGVVGGGGSFDQITELDALITADMAKLGEARPEPAPGACVSNCRPHQMSSTIAATAATPPECKPAATPTCTDSCKLKDSICTNAGKICQLAADLGGNDAYANGKCNTGSASCEAAKKRCCSCL